MGYGHGTGSLCSVQQQRGDSQNGRLARDIRCSDIAAAAPADVLPAEEAHEKVSERYRTEQIAGGGDEENREHRSDRVYGKSCELRVFRSFRRKLASIQKELAGLHRTKLWKR